MGIIIEASNPLKKVEDKIKEHRRTLMSRTVITIVVVIAAIIGTYFLIETQTYSNMREIQNYVEHENDYNNYQEFGSGMIKYSRDGVAYLNQSGDELWNYPCQISNPFLSCSKDSFVVGDKGGTTMMVFDKQGRKGEINANSPIQQMVISNNGIVAALFKNGATPKITCYDAAGNELAEIKASLYDVGYPIGIAISPDGSNLQVSYLCTQDGVEATRVAFYHFGTEKEAQITGVEEVYKNTILPVSFYSNNNTTVIAGDQGFYIYKGEKKPKLQSKIEVEKEVKSIFYNDTYIGFVLVNTGQSGYELRLYDLHGEQKISKDFDGDYSHIKISDGNVIMYDGQKCAVFTGWGVQKFDGEADANIIEMFPLNGLNTYMLVTTEGISKVRLVK